ncbi:hypothetical protein H696_04080 [Fonticula alba]|uniref:B box-type domain-containing protein n=1 Tax=Fonticula alba TaxID=691883 RepID=A0A058Z6C0_FONAL|nr:hypothetical protein H696_04080 [Fonticula alba]KCV69671.1 hypothetical protein H696_04080 [Fonticula alba]|eukprot:XP_009496236.1 hypothetical protein H696_04080 [Fonticula alba]
MAHLFDPTSTITQLELHTVLDKPIREDLLDGTQPSDPPSLLAEAMYDLQAKLQLATPGTIVPRRAWACQPGPKFLRRWAAHLEAGPGADPPSEVSRVWVDLSMADQGRCVSPSLALPHGALPVDVAVNAHKVFNDWLRPRLGGDTSQQPGAGGSVAHNDGGLQVRFGNLRDWIVQPAPGPAPGTDAPAIAQPPRRFMWCDAALGRAFHESDLQRARNLDTLPAGYGSFVRQVSEGSYDFLVKDSSRVRPLLIVELFLAPQNETAGMPVCSHCFDIIEANLGAEPEALAGVCHVCAQQSAGPNGRILNFLGRIRPGAGSERVVGAGGGSGPATGESARFPQDSLRLHVQPGDPHFAHCVKHPQERVEHYCIPCQEPVCRFCRLGAPDARFAMDTGDSRPDTHAESHSSAGHQLVKLQSLYADVIRQAKKLELDFAERRDILALARARIANRRQSVVSNIDFVRSSLESIYQATMRQLDEHRTQKMRQLDEEEVEVSRFLSELDSLDRHLAYQRLGYDSCGVLQNWPVHRQLLARVHARPLSATIQKIAGKNVEHLAPGSGSGSGSGPVPPGASSVQADLRLEGTVKVVVDSRVAAQHSSDEPSGISLPAGPGPLALPGDPGMPGPEPGLGPGPPSAGARQRRGPLPGAEPLALDMSGSLVPSRQVTSLAGLAGLFGGPDASAEHASLPSPAPSLASGGSSIFSVETDASAGSRLSCISLASVSSVASGMSIGSAGGGGGSGTPGRVTNLASLAASSHSTSTSAWTPSVVECPSRKGGAANGGGKIRRILDGLRSVASPGAAMAVAASRDATEPRTPPSAAARPASGSAAPADHGSSALGHPSPRPDVGAPGRGHAPGTPASATKRSRVAGDLDSGARGVPAPDPGLAFHSAAELDDVRVSDLFFGSLNPVRKGAERYNI